MEHKYSQLNQGKHYICDIQASLPGKTDGTEVGQLAADPQHNYILHLEGTQIIINIVL